MAISDVIWLNRSAVGHPDAALNLDFALGSQHAIQHSLQQHARQLLASSWKTLRSADLWRRFAIRQGEGKVAPAEWGCEVLDLSVCGEWPPRIIPVFAKLAAQAELSNAHTISQALEVSRHAP